MYAYAYALFEEYKLSDPDSTPKSSETSEISETDEMYGGLLGGVVL